MKLLAREFNQSETTFLLPPTRPEATVRLPAGAEVFGAGHNALDAWWWVATAGRLELAGGAGTLIEQGWAMGRPSLIGVEIDRERVRIGRAGIVVGEGNLRI